MKSPVIFYFSGTGNSRYVAEKLAKMLKGEAVNLIGFDGEVEADKIGFVTACYCNNIPDKAYELIEKLKIKRVNYLFCVTTSQASDGYSALTIQKLLRAKGRQLNLAAHVGMLSTFVITVAPIVGKTEKYYTDKENAQISAIAADVGSSVTRPVRCVAYPVMKVMNKVSYFGLKNVLKITKKSVSDKCTGCSRCADICPCENIKIVNGRAVFGDNCTYCYGCAHVCPAGAVKYGMNNIKGSKQYKRFL